jgi:sulfite exporter TauE/SafE
MNEFLPSVVLLGFVLGMRHATDPDHVIAVGTIVSREPTVRGAALIGVVWGIGHSLTILAVGGAIVLLGFVIPPRLGLGMELSVAIMLIILGGLTVAGRLRRIAAGEATAEVHERVHAPWLPRDRFQMLRPFVVGVVHGLAGSAAVALLVVAVIPSPVWALVYLLVFGMGTVAGMMLVTIVTVLPFLHGGRRLGSVHRYLALASATLSLVFGFFLVYRIGIVDGLFTAHPLWTPG